MDKKLYLMHTGTPHEGSIPHSGRYAWGSGEDPYQHRFDFLHEVEELRKKGMSNTEIAKAMGYSTGEWRAKLTNQRAEKKAADYSRACRLREKGWSNTAIANELGMSEGSVRNLFKTADDETQKVLDKTSDILRKSVETKNYIDIGEGVERDLGIARTKFDAAVQRLKDEGYTVVNIQVPQINSPNGQKTTVKVLAPPDTPTREIYEHLDEVKLITEYHSKDNGLTWGNIKPPVSLDSKRLEIIYTDSSGTKGGIEKDGVIELRPGVEDISLGDSKYAQVRIVVDGKYYLKGMAMYNPNLPPGVDVRFNTNKTADKQLSDVLKPLKTTNGEPDGPIDWENPFGATIKANGQREYTDKNGNKKLSVINMVNEEGDWGTWDRTLASQFLSKQDLSLAKKQLNITYLQKQEEFEEILSLTNPIVKQELLRSFSDDCDASAVDLKAAAMPRQATQVILPLPSLKENEIYAPNFKDGEYVALVRYPHSGPSEIPSLRVNNKNQEAISIVGKTPKDCVMINPAVAAKLSGADFDGDTVVVIPNKGGKTVNVAPTLEGLKNFDPKRDYPAYPGMKVMKESAKGAEMGKIANLITDMTLQGCDDDELARAIRHSMVVIDAPKHKLNWKQSEKDNRIKELRIKYQNKPEGGAATLISRSKGQEYVDERRLYVKTDPNTGEKIYSPTGNTWTKTWTLKDGTVRTKEMVSKTKTTKMANASDAFQLLSDPKNPDKIPMEKIYAIYANQMKDLGNKARLESLNVKTEPVNKAAKIAYAPEIESLEKKLNKSLSNAPHERQAQMAANVKLKAIKLENPALTDSEKRKKGQQALNSARARLIPDGKKYRIEITPKEWEAIQAGAISSTKLRSILNNTDLDKLKEYATPRQTRGLSPAKLASAKAMLSSGYYTQAEVAEKFNISTTSLMRYVKES